MLVIHRAERADALVAALAGVLEGPSADPFQPEVVAVPSKGVERWLAQQLSHRLGAGESSDGVCANVVFPSSTQLLDDIVAEADDGYRQAVEQWNPERAVWPLMAVIDRCAPAESWCRVLAAHLGLDELGTDKGRRFAVASKIAALFHRYGSSRPHMLRDWHAGRDEQGDGTPLPDDLRWQAELWRRLRAEIGVPAPAELLESACERLRAGPDFSIFGTTRISPARARVLHALAGTRDIHLWLHHPSPALWDAIAAGGDRGGPRRRQQPVARHPILASMARDVRELQQLLSAVPHDDLHHPVPPRPATLLGRLQDDLAHDRPASLLERHATADGSIQIRAAHGPARQVEVLREAILARLADDPSLEPRDVLIMCPDVEAFAPLVAASFGMTDEPGAHPAGKLRVRLADRALRQTNPMLTLLSQLLEVAAGRVTATQLLDLAGAAPVRRKFRFDDDDVERLREWTIVAGARWGLDATHRGRYQLSNVTQGTWRAALDRILLGVTMEGDTSWVAATVPLDDVDSADIDLAGRFAEFVARVHRAVSELSGDHRVPDWAALLTEVTLELGEASESWQVQQLRRELDEVSVAAVGSDVRLGLSDVAALLRRRLAGRPTRASFRTGTLTVCTLVPMRSVPHRVVCLLGMDDGTFPRKATPDGDDVLAREPCSGERDPRSEDRQLFLDAVCAAQEHLIITYTGADPRTGSEVPPCVPLGELMDALGPARDDVLVRHPLQPFDRRNFVAGALGRAAPFSYDPAGLAGARAAARQPREQPHPLVDTPLDAPPADTAVSLDDLVRFLQHPVRGFLRQRLGLALGTDEDEPSDAVTIELDGLQEWGIGDRVLRQCLRGTLRRTAERLEHMRGDLPPGRLGADVMQRVKQRVDALLRASQDDRVGDPDTLDIAAPLWDGRVLTGTVTGVHADTIVTVMYSQLSAKQRLASWVRYLAVVAGSGSGRWRSVTVGRDKDDAVRCVFGGIDPQRAVHHLSDLVRIRDEGMCGPLPLALATSEEYARRRHRGFSIGNALGPAEQRWTQRGYPPEREEPEHVLVYGELAPFRRLLDEAAGPQAVADEPTRFGSLARRVWDPLFAAERAL